MSPAAKSIYVFSLYLFVNAFLFIMVPNAALGMLGLPATEEVWIRCLGIVIGVMAYYHLQAAQHELTVFFRATIPGRFFVLCALAVFVASGLAAPRLAFFGLVDATAALWTVRALRTARMRADVAPS